MEELRTEQPKDEPDIVLMVKEKEREAEAFLGSWVKEARENYDMVAGNGKQWDKADRALLESQQRPCVEFNRVGVIIDAVSGSEVNNRQEVKYLPRTIQDAPNAEMRTAAAKWVRDNCDAEDEESDAFVDVLVCGLGATQTRMDYEQDREGRIVIERIDPLELAWDPSSRKRNLADARWISRKRKYRVDEIEAKWPEKSDEIKALPGYESEQDQPHITKTRDQYGDDEGSEESEQDVSGLFEVTHFQWYELKPVFRVLTPEGSIVDMDEERFNLAHALYPSMQYAKTSTRTYKQAFVCGEVLLESGDAPCQHGFTIQAITGKRDRNRGHYYGLVRPMKDPQRWANKFFSQILHIINTNAKGGVMFEKGAVENVRKFKEKWAQADTAVELNPGGLQKLLPKPVVNLPMALPEMMNFAISSIRDTGGVNLELLGLVDREQAGVLEAQRTKAGLTILAPFFDAMRLYRKKQGRVLSYFINQYISDGRLIRILGDEQEQYVPLVQDPDGIEYDVVVDSAPTARDVKEQGWMALREIIPLLMQAGVAIPPEAMDYLPVPNSLSASLKKSYMERLQQPPPPNPDVVKEQAKTEGAIQKAQVEAQIRQQESQMEAMTEGEKLKAEAQVRIMESAEKARIEHEKMQLNAEVELRKALIEAQTKLAEKEAEMRIREGERARADSESGLTEAKEEAASTTEAMAAMMQQMSALIELLARPKKATLPSGKTATIETI